MGFLGKNSIVQPNSKYNKSPNGGFYYNNEFWYSNAYQSLTISARELLHSMICELRWSGRGTKMEYTNNGQISFTEVQYKKRYGYESATYIKSRNSLIEYGLIKQTYRGGMCRGDMAKYKLLFIKGVLFGDQRWREYPEKNWLHEIPKAKNNQVGINTRFKKGKSGGKLKPTLPKYTHNEANDPIKVTPIK